MGTSPGLNPHHHHRCREASLRTVGDTWSLVTSLPPHCSLPKKAWLRVHLDLFCRKSSPFSSPSNRQLQCSCLFQKSTQVLPVPKLLFVFSAFGLGHLQATERCGFTVLEARKGPFWFSRAGRGEHTPGRLLISFSWALPHGLIHRDCH